MISIIIPSYNQAEYLSDAIDSALSQTIGCQLVIVDDGSIDASLEIAKGYSKKFGGVKVISQVNKGLASARNTGIMNASGNYCLFLDADDILWDNCIEKIEEKRSQTGADIIAPSFKEFGVSQREVILMPNPTIEDFKIANRIGYCAAIKRDALLEVGGYSSRMTWGAEDYHLWFNLLSRGKTLVTIPEVLWLYRTKLQSMWQQTKHYQEEYMSQIKKDFPQLWIS